MSARDIENNGLCHNCRTVNTCIELGCGQGSLVKRAAQPSNSAEDVDKLYIAAKAVCDFWDDQVPPDCVNDMHRNLRAAIAAKTAGREHGPKHGAEPAGTSMDTGFYGGTRLGAEDQISRQVAEWRKDVARLNDLIAFATAKRDVSYSNSITDSDSLRRVSNGIIGNCIVRGK